MNAARGLIQADVQCISDTQYLNVPFNSYLHDIR